ncbi:nuclear receptor subfamily 1 group I member 3-like isoform X5 [Octodon degus]|uniref:Nuclear receptor subfamily 1 group I member 3 n=1 Tax=Octodon degus TaxID=10160 RepID=A0A6P6DAS9_OCTDE|nr:nuclear receptor subfamily 1 group I member 3-like isoform X5 [Octodon degus]
MAAILTPEGLGSSEQERRSCAVCGDRATGYNFHALTCEACKGFFRRAVNKSTEPTCPFTGSCEVSRAQRRHCPACRLQKCLDAGMRKDMVLSPEALVLRRAKQAWRRAQHSPMKLRKEQKELVQILLEAHTRYVATMFDQFVQFKTQSFLCGPLCYTVEDIIHGFQKDFVELILHFHGTLRRLQLQEAEYVLMAAMALFSPDRPGVTQRVEVEQLQEKVALTLDSYIKEQQPRPQKRFLYAKLLGLLAELRSINNEYWYQIQRIQGLPAMIPLLQEICS